MAKKGKAHIVSADEWERVYTEISMKRHATKNRLIIRLCQSLGLKVKEIVKLKIKDVATLDNRRGDRDRRFELNSEIFIINNSIENSADAGKTVVNRQKRKRVNFSIDEFEKVIHEVAALAIAGEKIDPKAFYPVQRKETPLNRVLPLSDSRLREDISNHLEDRLLFYPYLQPSDSLIVSQKGGAYSPNTLQTHIAKIFRWAGINASSSSGRRTLLVELAHNKKVPLEVVQAVAGHKTQSTTVIYKPD